MVNRPDLPEWVQNPTYIALHTSEPARGREGTEARGDGYGRVAAGVPMDWSTGGPTHRAVFTAPTGGDLTHASFTRPDGSTQWLDMTTDPPTPCDPPPGWVDGVVSL